MKLICNFKQNAALRYIRQKYQFLSDVMSLA